MPACLPACLPAWRPTTSPLIYSLLIKVFLPFGGIPTILSGDFYQLHNIGGHGIIDINVTDERALAAQEMFVSSLTDCVLLVENERAKGSDSAAQLASVLMRVRTGDVTQTDLATLNSRVVNSLEQAIDKSCPTAVFVTSTHKRINEINAQFQAVMTAKGCPTYRLIAKHTPVRIGVLAADDLTVNQRRLLYNVQGNFTYFTLLFTITLIATLLQAAQEGKRNYP